MKTRTKYLIAAALVAGTALGASSAAYAQTAGVQAAIGQGIVGEQADGYLGFNGNPSAALRGEVEQINIKRRAAYTARAAERNVTVQDVAAAVGCRTLANRVGPGQAYRLTDGVWRTRSGSTPIPLPDYCA